METAANIRSAVAGGTGLPATRAGRLIGLSRAALARAPSVRAPEQLREAVTFSHYSTLACALIAQPRPNEARFDELVARPPDLAAPMAPAAPGAKGAMPGFPPGIPGAKMPLRPGVGLGGWPGCPS